VPNEPVAVGGLDCLALATRLLQAARLADPTAGLWEAADAQWWFRRDPHTEPDRAWFWFDGDAPVAALVITDAVGNLDAEVISLPGVDDRVLDDAWRLAGELGARASMTVETMVREDDTAGAARARAAGFERTEGTGYTNWMDAAARPAPEALPAGYRLASYEERRGTPHWMVPRVGEHVAARLAQCSLYRPDLDLAVLTDTDEVAAYGLFWPDPVTRVGLVEPMRTAEPHQRRGLARRVLLAGLDRLAGAGCTRLKIGFMDDNPAAQRCYLGAGFVRHAPDRVWQLPSHA
jgi:RimJ/RimL family protein N-acetyltransferase